MSAKELMLLSKHKYDLLTQSQTRETVSVETQTCDEKQSDMNSDDEKKACLVSNKSPIKTKENASTVQAVRSASWDSIPGTRTQNIKKNQRKSIKWIPY